ncbi:MAG: hypothetical protein QME14_06740 [Methanobacteriaceae archaeon]|nr:hypothetical protein [Methanobacteriaceae archaeon]
MFFVDPLERIWRDWVFDFYGIKNFHRRMFRIMASSTDNQRKKWLDEVQKMFNKYFP